MVPYLADVLVVLGVLVMTVGVYGAIRMPDTHAKLHSMSRALFLGAVSLCASSVVAGGPGTVDGAGPALTAVPVSIDPCASLWA